MKAGKAKKLSRKEINKLIIDHQVQGQKLAWSFLKGWRIRLPQDDVTSVVGISLCEAAVRFDPTLGVSFNTFFFYHLRGILLKEITKLVNEKRLTEYIPQTKCSNESAIDYQALHEWPFPTIEKETPETILEKQQLSDVCWSACSKLDELEFEVVARHFVEDHSLKKIAVDLGYCRCHISRVKSRALAKITKLLPNIIPALNGKTDLAPVVEENVNVSLREAISRKYTGGRGRRKTDLKLKATNPQLGQLIQHREKNVA